MTIDVTGAPIRRPGDTGKHGVAWQPGMNRQNPPGGMGPWDKTNAGPVVISVSGPWFDGRVAAAIAAMISEIQYRIAAAALERVQYNLDRSIQFPTPYYETQVMMQAQANDLVVHDRGIIYGPWLEGVSHRNQTTRFKGYHSFRRAADETRRQAPAIAQRVLTETLPSLS
jgi:hypothetical protein